MSGLSSESRSLPYTTRNVMLDMLENTAISAFLSAGRKMLYLASVLDRVSQTVGYHGP